MSQKKHCLKRLSVITFNFRSCKLKIIVFRCCSISFLNKNQGKFVISTKKSSAYHKFLFFVKKTHYLRICCFIFAISPGKTLLHVSEKLSDQRKKKRTSLIHRPPIHQWCPLIRGSTVILNKENPSQHYNHMN